MGTGHLTRLNIFRFTQKKIVFPCPWCETIVMLINEIFYSLQGEGSMAGVPGVFIRLAGCPLRCKWCDTKYAWHDTAGQKYSPEQVKQLIAKYPTDHLVLTGGEPMVTPHLKSFLEPFANMHITIETSGIEFVADLPCNLMSISPKLSNSIPDDPKIAKVHNDNRWNLAALQSLIDNYDYQLKFVVDNSSDLDEIAECLQQLKNIRFDRVYLMAQAVKHAEYIEKSRMIAEVCKQTGFRFSPRLQVMLWEGESGR